MSDIDIVASKSLLHLALEKFGELKLAEQSICKATEAGEVANIFLDNEDPLPLNKATPWGPQRTVRAQFLEWIVTSQQSIQKISCRGVRILGAYIQGLFDISYADICFPLLFNHCFFSEDIHLVLSTVRELDFTGSYAKNIKAEYVQVKGSVKFNDGFTAKGEVCLAGARIGGDLECAGGRFLKKDGYAINADRITVAGSVFLQNKCKVCGAVRLVGAKINGTLSCIGGKFLNKSDYAINANRMSVNCTVFLRDGCLALGEVCLLGANIGGNLDCSNSKFLNKDRDVINAVSAKINGSIFFDDSFVAKGTIDLTNSVVSHHFNFRDISKKSDIVLDLSSARIGFLNDHVNSWPPAGNIFLHGLTYDNISAHCDATVEERIDWLSRQEELQFDKDGSSNSKEFSTQPHEQLASIYLKNGHYNHARKILFDKNKAMDDWKRNFNTYACHLQIKDTQCQNQRQQVLDRMHHHNSDCLYDRFHVFLGKTVGYGYEPHRALCWILGFLLAGVCIFSIAFVCDIMVPAQPRYFTPDAPQTQQAYPGFNPILYSIEAFLPVIDLGVEKYWTPNTQGGFSIHIAEMSIFSIGGVVRLYLWVHILAGWTLTTLFLGSISGFIRR